MTLSQSKVTGFGPMTYLFRLCNPLTHCATLLGTCTSIGREKKKNFLSFFYFDIKIKKKNMQYNDVRHYDDGEQKLIMCPN